MTPREKGFLLLTCELGDGNKPLTTAQFRLLTQRVRKMEKPGSERDVEAEDLMKLGYSYPEAERILQLFSRKEQLDRYLTRAEYCGCVPVTRNTASYPQKLRDGLGEDAPAVLWAKGDLSLLSGPMVALVGSRDLGEENRRFAESVGIQAAKQGYALVSGNARGADRTAQDACLASGGKVISIVADKLSGYARRSNVLYLSENSFDSDFSSGRALSRNHLIHSLGVKTFVAQCSLYKGGTWSGTYANLKHGRSPVFVFDDGSEAVRELTKLGATPVDSNVII